jgi:hypothetical protein
MLFRATISMFLTSCPVSIVAFTKVFGISLPLFSGEPAEPNRQFIG